MSAVLGLQPQVPGEPTIQAQSGESSASASERLMGELPCPLVLITGVRVDAAHLHVHTSTARRRDPALLYHSKVKRTLLQLQPIRRAAGGHAPSSYLRPGMSFFRGQTHLKYSTTPRFFFSLDSHFNHPFMLYKHLPPVTTRWCCRPDKHLQKRSRLCLRACLWL